MCVCLVACVRVSLCVVVVVVGGVVVVIVDPVVVVVVVVVGSSLSSLTIWSSCAALMESTCLL